MSWIKNKVFNNGSDFVKWLDKNFGKYIEDHISELHVHHTWKPNHSNKQPLLQLHENMRNYHVGTRGWSDIGQHLSIGKNGDVALGRDIKIMPASAFGYNGATNWHPFMFEMIGDFDKGQDKLDGDQLDTVMAISQYFNKKNKKIRFHRELDNKKSCPGTGISKEWFMSQVTGKKVTQKESAPKTEVKSSTTKKSTPKAKLTVDGKWAEKTTKALQVALGTPADSKISDQLSNSVTKAFYGNTIEFGNGKKGSMMVGALQRKIGSKDDDLLGPETIGDLQKYLGTPYDKVLSRPSAVVKELQRRLNAGTF
ncbi:peptidoglycan recognition family protein [Tetragenococcus halophilus]|uniref:peptidoglycan recognition protein family protein n=1 Tax=Tetragenococcus halophilus TaxID=51669 RepID=UPI0030F0D361